MELRFLIFGLFVWIRRIDCGDIRSSLTFVIDDTGSMEDDIQQVKQGAKAIFDTVIHSNSSQIEDYVLVTINDPTFKLRKATKDPNAFKEVLDRLDIDVGPGNIDCPELSMSGIQLALQKSREASSLYVFTDASAKDYEKYDEVEALSQKMGCQIIFVLTGSCRTTGGRTGPQYLVYSRLAKATNGQVFHLEKHEIGKILEYVKYNIESRKNILASKTFPGGHDTFDITVDADTKELVIAVSGKSPSVSVTDSGGTKWPTTDMTRLSEVAVVKVVSVKPDVYKVEIGGINETHVVVSGSTSVHFQHGFSIVAPPTITDTVSRPVPGVKSYLSIQLATEGGEMELRRVQILDMDDKVIMEKPLTLVNKAEQFYTTEQIVPPDHMFKIAIKAYDVGSKTELTRISLTPIKPQESNMDKAKKRAPVVDCKIKVTAAYDKPLQLKCKISGFPKPDVTWETDDKTAVFSHFVSTMELPYDYISILDVTNVKNNATYSCNAVNSEGSDSKSIGVETKISNYFTALEVPKDTTIEYQKSGKISCKIDAYPPATVSWYKNVKPLTVDDNLELDGNGSVLIIRSMEPYLADSYTCVARNSLGRRTFNCSVEISGVEAPEINKTLTSIKAVNNSTADIQCQVTKGKPTLTLIWYHKSAAGSEFKRVHGMTESLHIDKVGPTNAGTYRCIAENIIDWDYHQIDLIVEYAPTISKHFTPNVTANQGERVTLKCPADGVPAPEITWKSNGVPIRSTPRYIISAAGTLMFPATVSDEGEFECEAKNSHGVDKINMQLNINVPVDIQSPKDSVIHRMQGLPLSLACRADGSPKPRIMWYYRSKGSKKEPIEYKPSDDTGRLYFHNLALEQSGEYTCVATNDKSSKNITYEVSVSALPSIQTTAEQFQGIVNDMQLQIPCIATGNPKPDITWLFGGYQIASGTRWYDISKEGTLTIKNIQRDSAGVYECNASNIYGNATKEFNVIVNESPDPGFLSNEIKLEEGTSATIPCSILQKKTDTVQWFKDGRLASSSELELRNVTESDAGTYICRVSALDRPAQDASIRVEVGFKPRFTGVSTKNIPFVFGENAAMDCTATGIPEPEVKWYHDGNEISFNDYKYKMQMKDGNDIGRYTCVVSNQYGSVQQKFVVYSLECLLNIKNDYNKNEPLILIPPEKLTNFIANGGIIYVPKDETVKFVCPSSFKTIPSREVSLTCENEQHFLHQDSGKRYVYSDLKCAGKWQPLAKETGQRCVNWNSEISKVGLEIEGKFQEVYEVCLDKASKNPIYTKINMQPSPADFVVSNNTKWFDSGSPVDLDGLYDCSNQNAQISTILHRAFHRSDGCCFGRRMLVNPVDVVPELAQAATYTHLNVAPHWGTCNSENWDEVEQRIRDLVATSNRLLRVWTGTADDLQLLDARSEPKSVVFNGRGKSVRVPRYFWKVVQDSYTKASLAIIQVNVPDFEMSKAISYMRCSDVCKQATWMQGRHWRNVTNGFTYCCRLADFERVFGYAGVFPSYHTLLLDAIPTPTGAGVNVANFSDQ